MCDWVCDIERLGVAVKRGVSGAALTGFGSGGRVEYLLLPSSAEGLRNAILRLREEKVPFRVIGGGSNLLLPDEGFPGALIRLSRLCGVGVCGNVITADAGVKLPYLAYLAAENSLSGLEFACGIPGEVGGAVCMNAGAFGQSIKDVLQEVILLNACGEAEVLSAECLRMGHHFACLPPQSIALCAKFRLTFAFQEEIEARMQAMTARRRLTQPKQRSAGSVFRPANGVPAAVYIERTGLKGLKIGGAKLSETHCNFIVNDGGATTEDFFAVAEQVRLRVAAEYNVALEYEVERVCSPKKS